METENVLKAKLAGLKREHVCKTKVSEDHDEQTSTTITFDYSDVTVGDLLDIVERSETIKAQGRWRRASACAAPHHALPALQRRALVENQRPIRMALRPVRPTPRERRYCCEVFL